MSKPGRRAAFVLAGVACLVAAPTPADTQLAREEPAPLAQADIDSAIESARFGIPAMATEFQWTGEVPISDTGELDAGSDNVSLNAERISALVRNLRIDQLYDAVRMIVAHEVWHFVELQLGHTAPSEANVEERRIYECRADLMAGRYATKASPMPHGDVVYVDYSEASLVASRVWRDDAGDHPSARQRAVAVHFGALSAIRERPQIRAEDVARIDSLIGYRAEEPLDAWSRRACLDITHFGQAALASLIAESQPPGRPSENGDFDIVYTNLASQTVEVSTVIAAHIRRPTESDPMGFRTLYFPQRFAVAPCGRHHVTGTLPGVPDSRDYLSFRPGDDDTLISARHVATRPPPRQPLGSGLSAEDARFALAIQQLANNADQGFVRYRAGGSRNYGTSSFQSLVAIPGSRERSTQIIVDLNGGAQVVAVLSPSRTQQEAIAAFSSIRDRFRRIWPAATPGDEGTPEEPRFTVTLSRYARAQISVLNSQGAYMVYFTMRSNPLGLACD